MACTFWAGEVRLARTLANGRCWAGVVRLARMLANGRFWAGEVRLMRRLGRVRHMSGPSFCANHVLPSCNLFESRLVYLVFAVGLMRRRDGKSLKCESEQPNDARASRRSFCVCKLAGRSIDVLWAILAGLIWLLTFGIPTFLGVCLSALTRAIWEGCGSRLYPSSYP